MSRIQKVFETKDKPFTAFITGGDPDVETTKNLIFGMAQAGVDIIEIGVPFSDPVAEGPVIRKASERSLKNGCTVDRLFKMVCEIRKTLDIPLLFMTYANVIFGYGTEKFMLNCEKAGIDGVIIPDAPYEEREEFAEVCRSHRIDQILMVAPTSVERARMIGLESGGFLYCVSSLGVTGVRKTISTEIQKTIREVKKVSDIPCCIGFGISTPEQAREMALISDGIIIGSAIVRIIEKYGTDSVAFVQEYTATINQTLNEIRK